MKAAFSTSGPSPSRCDAVRRAVAAALWLACALSAVGPASAKTEVTSAQARTAQYVFVVDDSGSMSRTVGGEAAADPDRLSVFAARSILSMLDDADEATVVRLNGPADGEAIPPIAALSDNRAELNRRLDLDATLASYAGSHTPCAETLESLKSTLNAAYRRDVAQVVLFLTDGACTGGPVRPASFLRGLRSADDDLFQFYLLRFRGRDYTRALETLAERTGASAIEVSAADPTSILDPFATALSRSQGYESYVLTPSDARLAAHRGARRVRLLAVAPDRGQSLSFELHPAKKGTPPTEIGGTRAGVHQFGDGRRYRYAALDYRPGQVPVRVEVTGAGDDWKVVAVPEYRLFVDMRVRKGRCSGDGADVQFVEVGSDACLLVRLINEDGQVVTTDVASRGSEAAVRYLEPGADEPRELPASRSGAQAAFGLERIGLERGDHVFRPLVRLAVPGGDGQTVTLRGAARTLQVSSTNVAATPATLELGDLVPGTERFEQVAISGNFPPTRGRLVLQNRDEIPDCVAFTLGDKPEGEPQEITPGQTYTIGARVAPYCGPNAFKRTMRTALTVEFDDHAQTRPVPDLVIPTEWTLASELEVPRAVRVEMRAGQDKTAALGLSGNFKRDARFKAIVPSPDERELWPDADHLELVFLDADGEAVEGDDGPATAHTVTFPAGREAAPLEVQLRSDACCAGGSYRTEMALVAATGAAKPIRVPVEVIVEPAGLWRCWGGWILWGLALLVAVLLIAYVTNMFLSTRLIDRKRLAQKLEPLVWGAYGHEVVVDQHQKARVYPMIKRGVGLKERVGAWLKANPLVFGLPGHAYYETFALYLGAQTPDYCNVSIVESRDKMREVEANPEAHRGLLYVSAKGGLTFFGVPDAEGRLQSLEFGQAGFGGFGSMGGFGDGEDEALEVERLRNEEMTDPNGPGAEGDPAGWKVG